MKLKEKKREENSVCKLKFGLKTVPVFYENTWFGRMEKMLKATNRRADDDWVLEAGKHFSLASKMLDKFAKKLTYPLSTFCSKGQV